MQSDAEIVEQARAVLAFHTHKRPRLARDQQSLARAALLVRIWPVYLAAVTHTTDASLSADLSFSRLDKAVKEAQRAE